MADYEMQHETPEQRRAREGEDRRTKAELARARIAAMRKED